ncbi:hypothetical protein [Microbacterium elymi]|uniref:Uncharacterized protein n=1 Tax=Microbacterium elymi TaxID=2909587 RepID=A0ABY5NNG6_9MICO|nr:hypothetical protein [Microbacterium elymi]UUT36739.1 hypothetical protein L2X98_29390 [Microbacterium elymi]
MRHVAGPKNSPSRPSTAEWDRSLCASPPACTARATTASRRKLVHIAREKGVAAYIGDGANRWPAVHRLDAGRMVRLALEKAPAGSAVHAVGDEGVPTRAIAEAIGRGLGVPTVSIPAEDAADHFGWLGAIFALDIPASSAITQSLLDWTPTHPGLIEDLDAGHYFRAASV